MFERYNSLTITYVTNTVFSVFYFVYISVDTEAVQYKKVFQVAVGTNCVSFYNCFLMVFAEKSLPYS